MAERWERETERIEELKRATHRRPMMTVNLPAPRDAQPIPVSALPPLPYPLAQALPSIAGDKLREDAAMLAGVAALLDWFQQCYPQRQCQICTRWVDQRALADHEAAHGVVDRFLARIGMRVR